MTLLKQEFIKLKSRYNLHDLGYLAIKPSKHICFNNNPYLNAAYLEKFNYIIMRNGHISSSNLKSMLHEICHAIQNRENRLKVPKHHFKKIYALELEAEIFAHTEYNKIYANEFGKLDNWDLAEYSFYKKHVNKFQTTNDKCLPMSNIDLFNFIFKLKGKYKKQIIEIVQNSDHQASWIQNLKYICI